MNRYSEANKYFEFIKNSADQNVPPTPEQSATLTKEKANYNLILNIYNQSQDLAALVSNIQFGENIRNIFIKMQNSAFDFASNAYNSGISIMESQNYLNQIKGSVDSLKSKMPLGTFQPFDLIDKMVKTFIPMSLSAQSKNSGKKPAALVAITPKPGVGKLPTNISVQMPVK